MKTLEDALKTPGVIEGGVYETAFGGPSIINPLDDDAVDLEGGFTAQDLRLIADHLDPQPDNLAAVRAEAEAQHRAAMDGYEAFCRAIGMEPDCYEAVAHQVNARVERARREARREAFEQAAEVAAEYCWNRVKNKPAGGVAVFTSHTWQSIRDAIIAVGKGEFPELTLKATEEIRREALEEAAAFIAVQRNDVPMTGEEAATAIRNLIQKEPA